MVRQNVFYKITRHIKKKKKNVLAATNKWISFLVSIFVVFGCFAVIYMLLSMRRNPCGFLLLVRCYRMAVYVFWLISVYCNNKSLIDPLNSTFIVLKIQLYKKRRDVKKYLNLKHRTRINFDANGVKKKRHSEDQYAQPGRLTNTVTIIHTYGCSKWFPGPLQQG